MDRLDVLQDLIEEARDVLGEIEWTLNREATVPWSQKMFPAVLELYADDVDSTTYYCKLPPRKNPPASIAVDVCYPEDR